MEISHVPALCADTNSPEYRPLKPERVEANAQFYDLMIQAIDELVEEHKNTPEKDQVQFDPNSTEILLWKWSEQEIEEAKTWVADPVTRVRFLRARGWKLDLARDMMKAAVSWRRTFQGIGVTNIKEESIFNELKSGKAYFHARDKLNRPVSYILARLHDSNARDLLEVQRFCVWMIENEHEKLFKNGITRSCVVFDLGGFALRNMDYAFMKFMINILQNYYPDSMGKCLILNSPWLFSSCWYILKQWIDPVSQEKIQFIAQAELKNFIEESRIPKCNGGPDWEYSYSFPLDVFTNPDY